MIKKITQKQCITIGGHCWKRRKASYSTRYPNGDPRFRVCKHCGRREDLTKLKGIKGGDKMIPIIKLLNKIRWDKREKQEDYSLTFMDFGSEKEMLYEDIICIDEGFMVVRQDDKKIHIPTHKIRKVKNKGKIIWERKQNEKTR